MKKIFTFMLFSVIIGMSIIAQVPTNGLVACFPFNGNANDTSGNGNNGIVYGAVLTTDRFENPNKAYYFNGNDAYIEFPIFDYVERTIDLWFYANDADYIGSYGSIFQSDNPDLLYGNSGVAIKDIGGFKKLLLTISGITDTVDLTTNAWNNLAIVLDSNQVISFYYNGASIKDKTISTYATSIDGKDSTVIGSSRVANNQFFKGRIDDIRIYNRALSSCEILEIYNENLDSVYYKRGFAAGQATCETDSVYFYNQGFAAGVATCETLNSSENLKSAEVSVYPNPTNDNIILNVNGVNNSIDLSGQASAIYFLNIVDANGKTIKTIKVVKQ